MVPFNLIWFGLGFCSARGGGPARIDRSCRGGFNPHQRDCIPFFIFSTVGQGEHIPISTAVMPQCHLLGHIGISIDILIEIIILNWCTYIFQINLSHHGMFAIALYPLFFFTLKYAHLYIYHHVICLIRTLYEPADSGRHCILAQRGSPKLIVVGGPDRRLGDGGGAMQSACHGTMVLPSRSCWMVLRHKSWVLECLSLGSTAPWAQCVHKGVIYMMDER